MAFQADVRMIGDSARVISVLTFVGAVNLRSS